MEVPTGRALTGRPLGSRQGRPWMSSAEEPREGGWCAVPLHSLKAGIRSNRTTGIAPGAMAEAPLKPALQPPGRRLNLQWLPVAVFIAGLLSTALITENQPLLFLDLNGFKPVNDRLGHASGDLLLQTVAQQLQQRVRESDTLCRQGGDEFVLLIPDAPDLEQLWHLAETLQQAVAGPYPHPLEQLQLSASIGIARWPDHAHDAGSLLNAADLAMYTAKHNQAEHIAIATPRP